MMRPQPFSALSLNTILAIDPSSIYAQRTTPQAKLSQPETQRNRNAGDLATQPGKATSLDWRGIYAARRPAHG